MPRRREGIPISQPKSDTYLVILILTFGATLIATGLMAWEYYSLK